MRHPNPDILLHIAMADAYAAATEYLKFPEHDALRDEALKFERYLQHPTHLKLSPGFYTDDTEMSAANARVLIAKDPPYSRLDFADAYVEEFAFGGRRDGYSRGFQAVLERAGSGTELLAAVDGRSDKNGAAMRAAVFGVLPTVQDVLNAATVQARVTHDTPEGRFGARAVALMSRYALYGDAPLSLIANHCLAHLPEEDVERFGHVFREQWDGGPVRATERASVGVTTVHAAVHLVMNEPSLMAMLETAIRWGGDTDSVAAVAWGIASARFRDESLPAFLERELEGGSPVTGAARLRELGRRLMEKYA